jgi:ribosome-associated translation inhibitor RaiA
MRLDVRGQTLTPALLDHVERRLGFALSRFGHRIRRVAVRLGGLSGPRGGADQRCRVVVTLRPSGTVVVEDTAPDVSTAIDRGADRAQRAVARATARAREMRDSPILSEECG